MLLQRLHNKTYFHGADSMSLNRGVMKIRTRLFNEQFIEVMNNLQDSSAKTHNSKGKEKPTKAITQTEMNDEEDARLLRAQNTNNAQINYSELAGQVLRHCHVTRQIEAAQKGNFLRKNQGKQAWSHMPDVNNETAKSFGKIGFKGKMNKNET